MKTLVRNYTFSPSTRQIYLSSFDTLNLNQLLLITNVSNNSIIYNFADPLAGGYIISNVLYLSANTLSMSPNDYLQIFLDDLMVPSTDNTLSSINTNIGIINTNITSLNTTVSTSISAIRTVPMFVDFDSVTKFKGHYPVGGRYVDATSFSPISSIWSLSALSGFDAAFNIDMNTGGVMMLQGDLDKDIDSVTNFNVGYSSLSNYLSAACFGVGSSSTGIQALTGNGNRIVMFIQNLSTLPLIVKYGLGCNSSSFNYILYPGTSNFDGKGEKISDDRYKGDVSVNTTIGVSAFFIAWEGV